ncbi:MAG: hypothetical protein ABJA02_12840 [Acidobacteriota bacterium]
MKTFLQLMAIILALYGGVIAQTGGLAAPGEKHLTNIKQLTFGGENAEAYFSFDGKQLIFQSKRDGRACDQIYSMNIDGSNVKMVSNGEGRTTCAYFFKGGKKVLYASTFGGSRECPPDPDRSHGYVWPVYADYDIYTATPDGKNIKNLTHSPGYDAEATISPDGKTIVFTSERDGDLDLYSMDLNGKHVKRLTDAVGYDGGAFFSPDSKQIVYRRSAQETPEAIATYKGLLARHLIVPIVFEIWVMNADGSNKHQVTNLGSGSFAPFFTPDGKKIIFCTNYFDENKGDQKKQPNFDLVLINVDGTGIERITYNASFDGFPMFSPDGKKLAFASNRNDAKAGDTNVFIADWVN